MKITSITTIDRARFEEHHNNPESMKAFSEFAYVDYAGLQNKQEASLGIYVFPRGSQHGLRFIVDFTNNPDRIATLENEDVRDIHEVLAEIYMDVVNHTISEDLIPEYAYDSVVLSLQSIMGDLAAIMFSELPMTDPNVEGDDEQEHDHEHEQFEVDPSKIYIQFVNGQLNTIDRNAVNWAETIENIEGMARAQAMFKQMIFDMMSADTEEKSTDVHSKIMEIVNKELENVNMVHDYDNFKNVTEREKILLHLFDLNTLYSEIILVASILNTQDQMMKQIQMLNGGMPADSIPEDIEVPDGEMINDIDYPISETPETIEPIDIVTEDTVNE